MFQTFDSPSDPTAGRERVGRLREWLERQGARRLPRAARRRASGRVCRGGLGAAAWLTGFAGSAGVALILRERAHIFVDGRYTLQVRDQVDLSIFTPESLVETPPPAWIEKNLGKGARIGFDPWLHTIADAKALRAAAEKVGADVGRGRPQSDRRIVDRPPGAAAGEGRDPADRLCRRARQGQAGAACRGAGQEGVAHTVLTDPSSIAWAFNIRGSDVPHTPLALAFAILSAEGPHLLFIDQRKLDHRDQGLSDPARRPPRAGRTRCRAGAACRRRHEDRARPGARRRASAHACRGQRRQGGAARRPCPAAARHQEPGRDRRHACRPPPRRRGGDQDARLARPPGARHARRDHRGHPARGIPAHDRRGNADAAARDLLRHHLRRRPERRDHALPRLARHQPQASRRASCSCIDSGGQYQDGTTDITRTVAVGTPTEEMRERYTIVLKGMIGISMLRFPAGTRGMDIDAVARHRPLEGRPRLCARHRPRRRLVSVGA